MTYVCGVGDRHAANLLVRPDGTLLHVDNGFLLGEDPKPGMPVVRVPRDVVLAGEGGMDALVSDATQVYLEIRRQAHAVAAFLTLLPSKEGAVSRHLCERLCLDLEDAPAGRRFGDILRRAEESLSHRANDTLRTHMYDPQGAVSVASGALAAAVGAVEALLGPPTPTDGFNTFAKKHRFRILIYSIPIRSIGRVW